MSSTRLRARRATRFSTLIISALFGNIFRYPRNVQQSAGTHDLVGLTRVLVAGDATYPYGASSNNMLVEQARIIVPRAKNDEWCRLSQLLVV